MGLAGILLGLGALVWLSFRGFRSDYHAEIMTATLLCLALALVLDLLLVLAGRWATPWLRTSGGRRASRGRDRVEAGAAA